MATEAVQTNVAAEAAKTEKEINFEKLRKQYEQVLSEKQKAQEELSELRKQQQKYSYQNDSENYSDEPYVDHKTLGNKFQAFEEKFEKKVDQRAEEKARAIIEGARQQEYVKSHPDFYNTLTEENLKKFENEHPGIAERIVRMPDTFDRQALLYEQIKALQTTKKPEATPSIQDTIAQNRRGPFYQPSGIGNTPYSQVGDFSEVGQKNAYQKLQELKGRLRL